MVIAPEGGGKSVPFGHGTGIAGAIHPRESIRASTRNLQPYVVEDIRKVVNATGAAGTSGGTLEQHGLNSWYHTGELAQSSGIVGGDKSRVIQPCGATGRAPRQGARHHGCGEPQCHRLAVSNRGADGRQHAGPAHAIGHAGRQRRRQDRRGIRGDARGPDRDVGPVYERLPRLWHRRHV